MDQASLPVVEKVILAMTRAVIENEKNFCDLDAVAGDGDFGHSLARGFERVREEFDSIDRTAIGPFLKKIGFILTSACGGTSGPIWGTAFLRAASAMGDRTALEPQDVVTMLRAAIEGIQKRGGAELGDKTLLDALWPLTDCLEHELRSNAGDLLTAFARAAEAADAAATRTSDLIARRGRAAYTGVRSRGSPDAGAKAIAIIARHIVTSFESAPAASNA